MEVGAQSQDRVVLDKKKNMRQLPRRHSFQSQTLQLRSRLVGQMSKVDEESLQQLNTTSFKDTRIRSNMNRSELTVAAS